MVETPAARTADAERDLTRDLVHDARHVDVVGAERRAGGFVPAADVPPGAGR
jgi:hypothetical protein